MPEFGGVIGAARLHHALFVADQQFEPMSAHGGEMRPPRDEADIGARARELYPEISADCTGAADTDSRGGPRMQVTAMSADLTRWL